MGQMQYRAGSKEEVCTTIKQIEDNSHNSSEATLKQSIVQNVTNKGLGGGEFKVPGAHKGNKS